MTKFVLLASRLNFMKIVSDEFENIALLHTITVFENYIYGANTQYKRIQSNVNKILNGHDIVNSENYLGQISLDVYYYVMIWDKLYKTFEKIKMKINSVATTSSNINTNFISEHKSIKKKMEHIFKELRNDVRNEYEHPSFEPKKTGNIIEYGTIQILTNKDILCHVGKEVFARVSRQQIDSLNKIWIEYIDIFIKNFTTKKTSAELIRIRNLIEKSIASIINKMKGQDAEKNNVFLQLLSADIYLSKENVPLSAKAKQRIYSLIWKDH